MKILYIVMLALVGSLAASDWTNLWQGEAPGAPRPPEGSERVLEGQRFTDVEVPQYKLYQPEVPNGRGVVILPGGGYRLVSMEQEGYAIAEWCAKRGITAMVVKYRVSQNEKFGYQFPVPQLDARRAIRTMRAHGEEWGLDPKKIGVLGASAGGHLAATCMTLFDQKLETGEGDAIDGLSCRPDFAVLLYPVIGMDSSWGHRGSKLRLLGKDPSQKILLECSSYRQVTPNSPPVFIVHCADDPTVPLRNSAEFMSACAEKKVPVRAVIYPTGGHGFGGPGRGDARGWLTQLDLWLAKL